MFAQKSNISASGKVVDDASGASLAFVNVVLRATADSALISGTISNEKGLFTLAEIEPGDYFIQLTYLGYQNYSAPLFIGSTSPFINIGSIRLSESSLSLEEVTVKAERNTINSAMSKKSYSVDANISQSGASVLQSMA
ncbi:MAG: TonB-dependent receptor, partial [Bacteroidetes bacterium]